MSTKIWSDFNFSDVLVKPPQKNSMGGQNVYIDTNANTKSNPKFQLPRMKIPFGLDRNEQSQSTRYNLELSVTDPAFFETISKFDDKILTEAAKNSKEWFGKSYSKAKIQDMEIFRQSIQGSMDGQYPPLFRVKVPSERQIPKVYLLGKDANGKETWKAGKLSDISRGSYAVPIVECTGVWFVSKKSFGLSFVAKHMLIEKSDDDEAFPFLNCDATEAAMDIEEDNAKTIHIPPYDAPENIV